MIETISEAIDMVKDTLENKGAAYGPTYRRVAAALDVSPQYSILVRILEKCMRIDNIMDSPRDSNTDKMMAAEFLDIACYAILALFESSSEDEE